MTDLRNVNHVPALYTGFPFDVSSCLKVNTFFKILLNILPATDWDLNLIVEQQITVKKN